MGPPQERPAFGCFVDRAHEPSNATVRKALGEARAAWDDLSAHLGTVYGLTGAFYFMYGARYGWALKLQRGGRLAAAMYPNRGYLTMQLILNPAQVAAADAMKLPPFIRRALEAATDYPEGRWLFIPVTTRANADAVKPLIALKLHSPTGRSRPS